MRFSSSKLDLNAHVKVDEINVTFVLHSLSCWKERADQTVTILLEPNLMTHTQSNWRLKGWLRFSTNCDLILVGLSFEYSSLSLNTK